MTSWNLNFELRQLRQFVVLAEARSFRAAAHKLFIAQPALSVAMQKLERALGVALFHRTSRGISLTEAGQAFLDDARRTLTHAQRGRLSAQLAALGEWGVVRLGFVGSAAYDLLPRRLPQLLARYPSLHIEIIEGTTVGILDLMRNGSVDVGIVGTSAGMTDDLDLAPTPASDLMAVVASTHPLARRHRIDLALLRDEPFVMFSSKHVPGLRSVIVNVCREVGFTPNVRQEALQISTLVALVGTGLGVGLVPSVAASMSGPSIRFIRLSNPNARSRIQYSIALRKGETSLAAIRLAEHFSEA